MRFDEYQARADGFALPTARGMMYLIPGLAAEAGEVCGVHAKFLRDGPFRDNSKLREDMAKELGDCLWFIAVIAKQFDIPLAVIAEMNIRKLQDRFDRNKIGGSGDDR